MLALPLTQREVRLAAHPVGKLQVTDLIVCNEPIPVPKANELLLRNIAFLIAPSIRPLLNPGAVSKQGVPFPPVSIGDTLGAATIAEVLSAPTGGGHAPGDRVLHFFGWREFSVVHPEECFLLDSDFPDPLLHLSHGWTAYAALTRGAALRSGDTVFISSAAGAIGSMAGQIARLLGAARIVGSTSSEAKARRIVAELGYDAVVTRSGGLPFADQLRAAAPDGLDIVIDTVGGMQLDAALRLLRVGARVALIGTLAADLGAQSALAAIDASRFLAARARLVGYSADDDPGVLHEWNRRCAQWMREGVLTFPHALLRGLEHAPQALIDASAGKYIGAVIVALTG